MEQVKCDACRGTGGIAVTPWDAYECEVCRGSGRLGRRKMVHESCPVGVLAGDEHQYVVGTGVVVPWDVADDPRSGVEVCRSCADRSM